jgi:hypothetical protein
LIYPLDKGNICGMFHNVLNLAVFCAKSIQFYFAILDDSRKGKKGDIVRKEVKRCL